MYLKVYWVCKACYWFSPSIAHIPPLSLGSKSSSEPFPQTSITRRNQDYSITWQLSWGLLGHQRIDQSRHVPHHDAHDCHHCAAWAGSPRPRHSLQPSACTVCVVRLRLYMHQLGPLHKVLCVAMPSNERSQRGWLSVHPPPPTGTSQAWRGKNRLKNGKQNSGSQTDEKNKSHLSPFVLNFTT